MLAMLLRLVTILAFIALASGQEQLLMIFGGEPGGLEGFRNGKNVTLLSLDGGPPVPECLQNLNLHPRRLYNSCQATLGEGRLQ